MRFLINSISPRQNFRDEAELISSSLEEVSDSSEESSFPVRSPSPFFSGGGGGGGPAEDDVVEVVTCAEIMVARWNFIILNDDCKVLC